MTEDDAAIQSNKGKRWLRTLTTIVALLAVLCIFTVYLIRLGLDIAHNPEWLAKVYQDHAAAVLGLPLAALVALCAVLLLEAKSGPIFG